MSHPYIEITSTKQFEDILEKNEYVLVDFFASWCGPCKILAEQFEPIKKDHKNLTIVKVNIDEEDLESIVESHNVSSLPHVFLYHKKTVVKQFIGNQKDQLWEMAKLSDAK
ncbi:thioredoxin (macronuclear) [Tetrahymena thermophila SB210]|uniref:Dynein light chain 3 n=2 Tax=Tetrahymena thermophila TaxID=5911 RepID=DYL3_TETTS|nr:thioredoxin [Tetrahymena thermophila SB210]6ZYW_P Chain P, Thioredoxin [Tetrahymena thermophila SB210]7MOQ_P Chain P, Thioredoxin [Tetrahymena thermophila CU428]8BWY_P Chain P, Thioredoxin [Chlamydomonas reinhardtii]ABF50900.1 dynein light chain 3-likeB [Tetrahymena thermophila]EAS02285.1 thioredoxin [Tetrahymena thermophila SB210]|eukprot:XP_001022530.1 thioredoxin [Tetrahymena thermophila SB210]